jgi:hypothetical protein
MRLRKVIPRLCLVPAAVLAPSAGHYAMRVGKSADAVWNHLKRLHVDGERMRQQGVAVAPVSDDRAAWLGAVRGVREGDTVRPKVTIMASGIDEEARLLTLMIVLENPVPVHVIHQVRPNGDDGSICQTIIEALD